MDDWEQNPTADSPYYLPQTCKFNISVASVYSLNKCSDASEASVRLQLAEEERLADQLAAPIHDTSGTQCISQALLIEDLQ